MQSQKTFLLIRLHSMALLCNLFLYGYNPQRQNFNSTLIYPINVEEGEYKENSKEDVPEDGVILYSITDVGKKK